jgi:hypothetical protein
MLSLISVSIDLILANIDTILLVISDKSLLRLVKSDLVNTLSETLIVFSLSTILVPATNLSCLLVKESIVAYLESASAILKLF